MTYSSVPLRELLAFHDVGVWGPEDHRDGISVLRSTNFDANGSVYFENLSFRSIDSKKRQLKTLAPMDILVEKSGGGPTKPVGRVCLFRGHHLKHAFSNFTMRLRALDDVAEPEYLFWCLHYLHASGGTKQYQHHTSGIRNLETNRYLEHPIPLPPLDDQRQIVDILNRAARLEYRRTLTTSRIRKLASTLFISMFGDPIENTLGWATRRLGNVSEIQGGLQVTKKRATYPLEKPYVRVANVLRDQLVLDEIKYIRLTEKEFERVLLKSGDLLIVEGHGNPAEIGRVAVWDGSVGDCVHQNHLIRLRPDHSFVTSEFVGAYLNSTSGRQHLLRSGKTTSGLNTITTSDVKACSIFVPPLALQFRFEIIVQRVRKLASTTEFGSRTVAALHRSLATRLLGDDE